MGKRPRGAVILNPRPEGPEVIAFYGCPNERCKIRHWPVATGDRCPDPRCNTAGVYLGMVAKVPDPEQGASHGGTD